MNEQNDRKVIPLNAKFKKQMTTPNDLRAAATGTIALFMFIMIGFNFSMFQARTDADTSRSIASVTQGLEPQWQDSLAHLNRHMLTQAGHRPTAVEALSFGPLEGQYSVDIQDGAVQKIRFANQTSEPKVLDDRLNFIRNYAGALAPGFKAAEKIRVEASDDGFKETYKVDTDGGAKVFEFQIDKHNRLVSLDIK